MTKFLFASIPVTGHVNPGLPIARELVARGHDVRWYSTPRFQRAIEGIAARYVPYRRAMQIDEQNLEGMFTDRPKGGIAQIRYDVEKIFVEIVLDQTRDLMEELDREPADVVVGDNAAGVAGMLSELREIPWAVYGINPLAIPSPDVPPFGLGLMPSATVFGRLRNRALYWLVDRVLFGRANKRRDEIRAELGLPPVSASLFDGARRSDLYLHGTIPSFEYPRTDMPPQLRFIGASIPEPPANWTPPAWWGELDRRRVVLVTQGTINNDYDQLIRPAIRALARENVLVVVTTGSRPASDVGIDPLPSNVIVERFLPSAHLMPKVDLLLTNGGYGSIQIALAHGVPIVAIGKTEEKPEIANRVQWSGCGIGLKVMVPTEQQIRDAVTRVLVAPTYRLRAEEMAKEMAGLNAPEMGAELLEELAGVRRLARSA